MPETREQTATGYAEHVKPPEEPKPAMGSQGGIGAMTAEAATQASHEADHRERMTDFANKFPDAVGALDDRADFSRRGMLAASGKTMAQLVAESEAAKQAAANGRRSVTVHGQDTVSPGAVPGAVPGARLEYSCGCVATHPDPNFVLPADCPTHSVPFPQEAI